LAVPAVAGLLVNTRLAHAARLVFFYKNTLYKFSVIIIIIIIIIILECETDVLLYFLNSTQLNLFITRNRCEVKQTAHNNTEHGRQHKYTNLAPRPTTGVATW